MLKLKTQCSQTHKILKKKRERGRLKKNGWRTDFFCLISAFACTLEQREEEGPGRCCTPGGRRDGISPGGVAMGMVRVGMVNGWEGKRLPPALKICRNWLSTSQNMLSTGQIGFGSNPRAHSIRLLSDPPISPPWSPGLGTALE